MYVHNIYIYIYIYTYLFMYDWIIGKWDAHEITTHWHIGTIMIHWEVGFDHHQMGVIY